MAYLPPVPARNNATTTGTAGISVNKQSLNNFQLSAIQEAAGIRLEDGEYWYDKQSGLWGSVGGPALGTITPDLPLPGSIEGSWASGSGSNIWVNGREIHWLEVSQLPLPTKEEGSRFKIDKQGRISEESEQQEEIKLQINVGLSVQPYFSAAAKVVQSIQKWKMGGEHIVEIIKLTIKYGDSTWKADGTLKEFTKFHNYIKKHYQSLMLPSFPGKGIGKKRTTDVIVQRQEKIENYLRFVFNIRTIRENVRVLCLIGINDPIILPSDEKHPILPSFGIGGEGTENPFAHLTQEIRSDIGFYLIYCARKDEWEIPPATHFILNACLERLLITKEVMDNKLKSITLTETSLPCCNGWDANTNWAIIFEILLQSLKSANLDARVHVSIQRLCHYLNIPMEVSY